MTQKKGFFITFEGPEGAGKSSQLQRLAETLSRRGYACVTTREPGGTPLAETLRAILKEHQGSETLHDKTELLLMEAARSQHVSEVISPALEKGNVVLCDRFADSSTAYQGIARGIGVDTVRGLNDFAYGNCRPDLTILLDLPAERGFERTRRRVETQGEIDRFEEENLQFHHKVRDGFLQIAAMEPQRVKVVNADRDVESVAAEILRIVDEFLP